MSFKILTFFFTFFFGSFDLYGNPLKVPNGVFSLFYSGMNNEQKNILFNSEVLETKESDTAENIFPNLWSQVTDELQKKNIVLNYEGLFKNCTKTLVEFSLNSEQTEKENLIINETSASFKYNANEQSKFFTIEQPDITGNRAWVKFYTYCEEEDN